MVARAAIGGVGLPIVGLKQRAYSVLGADWTGISLVGKRRNGPNGSPVTLTNIERRRTRADVGGVVYLMYCLGSRSKFTQIDAVARTLKWAAGRDEAAAWIE